MLRFRAAVVLAAFLLFLVQPMAARRLLPWFGGAPGVWTACLLFFQAMLLAGYAYAHWVASGGSRRLWVHRLLLAASLVFLPLGLVRPGTLEPPTAQIVWLLARWSATATSYIGVLTPLVTLVAAFLLAGENPTITFLVGSLLVLVGVYVGALSPQSARKGQSALTGEGSRSGN